MIRIGDILSTPNNEQYKIKEWLGGGRIAQVFQAQQIQPPDKAGRQLAIKIATSSAENARLEGERRVLEAMKGNPGVPRLEGYGKTREAREEDDRVFLVMELVLKDNELARIARGDKDRRLPEPLGIEAALQYARLLQALHNEGYVATDRKLDDIIWDDQTDPANPRLIVLDWNVTAKDLTMESRQRDLYQFGLFWHELLLGTPAPTMQDRLRRRLEDHPHWQALAYGTQCVLRKALHPASSQCYQTAEDLVSDLEFLVQLLRQKDADDLRSIAKGTTDSRRALMALDVIRVHFPSWTPEDEKWAKQKEEELEKESEAGFETRMRSAGSALRRGEYANAVKQFDHEYEQSLTDPLRALRVERWRRVAHFGKALSEQPDFVVPRLNKPHSKIFADEVLPILIGTGSNPYGIVQDLESTVLQHAVDLFWSLLEGAFLKKPETGYIRATGEYDPQSEKTETLRPPTSFVNNVVAARDAYARGDRFLTQARLQEARESLRDPWPRLEPLFAWIVGLEPLGSEQVGLLFLMDEAMLRMKLSEAERERRTGDLLNAARLYGQAQQFLEAIPYKDRLLEIFYEGRLFKTWLESPSDSQRECEQLARTLGEAEQCLTEGQKLMLAEPPEFQRALCEFETGLKLFLPDGPEWAQRRGEGLIAKLRNGQAQAQHCLDLQSVLGIDDLETKLIRCKALLDEFPDHAWGQQQREALRRQLIGQIEKTLEAISSLLGGVRPESLVAETSPSRQRKSPPTVEARSASLAGSALGIEAPWSKAAFSAAHLITLARRHFAGDEEIQKRLPGWELQAALVLQGEMDALVAQAEEKLRHGWQANLQEVLRDWLAGHDWLVQASHFPNVFWEETRQAQERKLEAIYSRINQLAQLQLDITTDMARQRAAIDEQELRRRQDRREAERLWQEAQTIYRSGPGPDRLHKVLEQVQKAVELWPERREFQDFKEDIEAKIKETDQQLKTALAQAKMALATGEYSEALTLLAKDVLPDYDLSPEQQEERNRVLTLIRTFQNLTTDLTAITSSAPEEGLERTIALVDRLPNELPEKLKHDLDECLKRFEDAFWRARETRHFWEIKRPAQVTRNLALAGLLRERVGSKVVFKAEVEGVV